MSNTFIIKSDNGIQNLLDFIDQNETLAFDIETTGLNVRKDEIIGFGVSNGEIGYYVAHKAFHTKLIKLVSAQKCVKVLNSLKNKKLITFNGSFDTRFTKHYFGVDLIGSIWSDAMLAKHTVDENRPFGLKEVAKKIFGTNAADEQKAMKDSIKANGGSAKEYFKADLDIMAKYCVQDCLLTFKLNDYYLDLIQKQGLSDFYFKDEVMPLYSEVTIPMELRGIPVDIELLTDTQKKIIVDINKLEAEIQNEIKPFLDEFEKWFLWKDYAPKSTGLFAQKVAEYAEMQLPKTATGKFSLAKDNLENEEDSIYRSFLLGGAYLPDDVVREIQMEMFYDSGQEYMFNLNSTHHLKKLFFQKFEETPLTKTPTGQPQVNDDFLELMAAKYSWANKLQDYKKLGKLKGTYIDRFLDSQEDGIFYPSFFQHRTISGRYGSDIQQLPRPREKGELNPVVLKYNNIIRKTIISGDNYKFIDADYESLEPHVFAHVSGDDGLKDIFRRGHDFYSTIAIKTEKLEGVSADKSADNFLKKVDAPKRQSAKAYSLGVPYGMEEYSLGKNIGVDQKEAKKLIDGYLNGFPNLKKWMLETNEKVKNEGYVRSEAGRIRHFPTAPKIWYAHSKYILDSLRLWQMFADNPKKYSQMKYMRKQMKNMLDNGKNFQIQSLSASIVNRAAIKIMRELKRIGIDGYVCANIHDQLVVRVPEMKAERCRKMVEFIMENTYKISLPLKAPAEIADNMYDGH